MLAAMASTSMAIQGLLVEGQERAFRNIDAALSVLSAVSEVVAAVDTSGKSVPSKELSAMKKDASTLIYSLLGEMLRGRELRKWPLGPFTFAAAFRDL